MDPIQNSSQQISADNQSNNSRYPKQSNKPLIFMFGIILLVIFFGFFVYFFNSPKKTLKNSVLIVPTKYVEVYEENKEILIVPTGSIDHDFDREMQKVENDLKSADSVLEEIEKSLSEEEIDLME